MRIFERDTGKELTYQGPNNLWTLPWGVAWGVEGRLTRLTASTGQTTMATATDITGFVVTWTPVLNRRYKASVTCELIPSATTLSMLGFNIIDSVAGQLNRSEVPNNQLLGVTCQGWGDASGLTAVSHATKVQAILAGTGTLSTANFSATRPAVILVEDIGPSGVPT